MKYIPLTGKLVKVSNDISPFSNLEFLILTCANENSKLL